MKISKFRSLIASIVFFLLAAGLLFGLSFGSLSAFGWETISAICPLGAVELMIASHTIVPRGLISLIVMGLLVLVVGRAFCGFICPVSALNRFRDIMGAAKNRKRRATERREEILGIANAELGGCKPEACATCGSSCKTVRNKFKLDSRHYVLGGTILSTAIFGFPVFCLVCPIGLSFASVILVYRLFAFGDTTWTVVLVLGMLLLEIFVFRKWCSRICPIGALMNLASRFSKTFVPVIDEAKCIESKTGKACSRCAIVCEMNINLRHPEYGEFDLGDCTRCRACVDSCPTQAISMPLLAKKAANAKVVTE